MRRSMLVLLGATALSACGQSGGDNTANQTNAAATNVAAKKHPTYCFFPDPADNKDWTANADKDGNVSVSGKARLEDRRYMARLGQADVTGTTASVWLMMTSNTTGMGAQENWWDVDTTVPNSAAVTSVNIMCGTHTLATLQVPRKAAPSAPSTKP